MCMNDVVVRVLHDSDAATLWSTGNVGEAIPGLCTPLTWSMWRAGIPGVHFAYHDLGLITDEERDDSEAAASRPIGIFFGRTAMNMDFIRSSLNRMPGASANSFEEALAGMVRPGVVDEPDEAARVIVGERLGAFKASLP